MTDVECEGGEGKLDIAEMTERISEHLPSLQGLEPGPEPLAPAFLSESELELRKVGAGVPA